MQTIETHAVTEGVPFMLPLHRPLAYHKEGECLCITVIFEKWEKLRNHTYLLLDVSKERSVPDEYRPILAKDNWVLFVRIK